MTSNHQNNSNRNRHPLAIVGIGCRFPGDVVDVESFWDLLVNGRSGIVEVPENRWNREHYYHRNRSIPGKMVTKWGGFVDNLDQFDAQFWGISPREALRMDPQQRWLLEVAWEAIEDAGISPQRLRGTNTGVFVGIASNDYAGVVAVHEGVDLDLLCPPERVRHKHVAGSRIDATPRSRTGRIDDRHVAFA